MNTKTPLKKPIQLRAIFILNLLLVIICYVFYAVAFSKGNVAGVSANTILYTAISYTVLFACLVVAIKKFHLMSLRIVLLLIFLVSVPSTAIIGMVISLTSLMISLNKNVKHYLRS